jgi:rSAM/selenodomain-associated transferase 2
VAHPQEVGILSVVVPTLNEGERLPRLLADLAVLKVPREIIVADGGSTDGTPDLAARLGCRVLASASGRGIQLRPALAEAHGEWFLVLHADVRLSPGALAEAEAAMARPEVQFAVWSLAIDAPGAWLRLVEFGAGLRWRLFGLAYGDQGLLVRRVLYEAAGGYPATAIMEDVALIRRLNRLATAIRFRSSIRADARRYLGEGRFRRVLTNLALIVLFSLGVPAERLARWYLPEARTR